MKKKEINNNLSSVGRSVRPESTYGTTGQNYENRWPHRYERRKGTRNSHCFLHLHRSSPVNSGDLHSLGQLDHDNF